jgi:hypothetical protein
VMVIAPPMRVAICANGISSKRLEFVAIFLSENCKKNPCVPSNLVAGQV